jgi:hypothetical protein
MRLSRSKRGTDKPIEIFIALFVILAVAMVILKMFSSQIEQKKNEMEVEQQKQKAIQAQEDLNSFCDTKCSAAMRTLKDKVTFCTSYYPDMIDINKNSIADYTMALDNIQGYCEDRIYCAAFRPCGSLDIKNCKQLVCDYVANTFGVAEPRQRAQRVFGYDDRSDTYGGFFQPGACWNRLTNEQKRNHWFNILLQADDILANQDSGVKCSLVVGSCSDRWGDLNGEFRNISAEEWKLQCKSY